MTKQQLIAVLVLSILGVGLYVFIQSKDTNPSVTITKEEEALFVNATIIEYASESDERTTVEYVGDLARITTGTYAGTVLRQVTSASGAKYQGETGLILWTKGDEVRLETPQQVVFTGITTAPIVTEEVVVSPTVPVEVVATTTASSTSSADIVGKWTLQQVILSSGELLPVVKPEAFIFTFTVDGELQGQTDCNGFGGTYTYQNGTLTTSNLVSTMMFCEGASEGDVVTLLQDALKVQIAETTMTLVTSNNVTLEFLK
jgi:heat shock protein HslJ/membrane-bound inhibitor of C-type lysozyme